MPRRRSDHIVSSKRTKEERQRFDAFPHQEQIIDELVSLRRTQRGVLICSPTGSGKTLGGATIMMNFQSYKWVIVAPRSLHGQWRDMLLLLERIAKTPHKSVLFLDYPDLVTRRGEIDEQSFVLCDEAHHLLTDYYYKDGDVKENSRVILHLKSKPAKLVLLTATPIVKSIQDVYPLVNLVAGRDVVQVDRPELYQPTRSTYDRIVVGRVFAILGFATSLSQGFITRSVVGRIFNGRSKGDVDFHDMTAYMGEGDVAVVPKTNNEGWSNWATRSVIRFTTLLVGILVSIISSNWSVSSWRYARQFRKIKAEVVAPLIKDYVSIVHRDSIRQQTNAMPSVEIKTHQIPMTLEQTIIITKILYGMLNKQEMMKIGMVETSEEGDMVRIQNTHDYVNIGRMVGSLGSVASPKFVWIADEMERQGFTRIALYSWYESVMQRFLTYLLDRFPHLKPQSDPKALFIAKPADGQNISSILETYKIVVLHQSMYEGVDLLGCRHFFVFEPPADPLRALQLIGRAVRLKSHAHLPEAERNVLIHIMKCTFPTSQVKAAMRETMETGPSEDNHTTWKDLLVGQLKQYSDKVQAFLLWYQNFRGAFSILNWMKEIDEALPPDELAAQVSMWGMHQYDALMRELYRVLQGQKFGSRSCMPFFPFNPKFVEYDESDRALKSCLMMQS